MATNTLLTSLIAEVYTLTKRPDLIDATKQAIKSSTLKLHLSDYFHKDLFETGVQFATPNYFQQLEIKTLIPTYRSLKYLRKVLPDSSANGYTAGDFLDVITPEQVLDSYNIPKEDIVYGAGSILQIRTSSSEKFFLIGAYVYPELTDEKYKSWIASEISPAVYYDAAATVFKGIGYDEKAAQFRNDSAMWMIEIKNSNITVLGS